MSGGSKIRLMAAVPLIEAYLFQLMFESAEGCLDFSAESEL